MSQLSTRTRQTGSPWALLGFIAAVALVALIGALASQDAQSVYGRLDRPSWAPPASLFGPAWAIFYLLIAVAGWLVWRRRGWDGSMKLWVAQLALNAAWTPLFFAAGKYWVAFADICALLVLALLMVVMFARRSRLAAALFLPYLAWVTYAAALNCAIALKN